MRVSVSILLILSAGYCALAQSPIGYSYWFDHNGTKALNTKWDIYGDLGARFIDGEKGYRRIIVRPSVRYHISNQVWASGGFGIFHERLTPEERATELRFFQGIHARWPNKKVKINHYFRVEQRIQFSTFANTQSAVRIRYAISGNINILKGKWSSYPFIHLGAEAFSTTRAITEILEDELRLIPGIGYRISPVHSVQLHAMIVRFRTVDVFETDQVVFRLRWFQLF